MRITQEQINLGLVWSKANRQIDTQKNRQIGLKICKYIGKEMYIVKVLARLFDGQTGKQ